MSSPVVARKIGASTDEGVLGKLLDLPPQALSGDRRRELIDAAAARSRRSSHGALDRLRANWWPLVQTAVAAGLSWLIALRVLKDPNPFFAPTAAIMSLAATRGQGLRRAVELILGVALGIGLGDLIRQGVGVGVWQLTLIVGLAMVAAVMLNAGMMMLTEAGVSASLVATVSEGTQGFPPTRLLDALVGGAVALVFSQLLFPVNPLKMMREAAESIMGELSETLTGVASALEEQDLSAAEEALIKARRVSEDWSRFEQSLDVAREVARYAPSRRRHREPLDAYSAVDLPLDLLVRDVHVLARGVVRALMIDDPVPERMVEALRDLARATGGLVERLESEEEDDTVRSIALRAAYVATELVPDGDNLSTSVLVGYTQATSADVLRAVGMERKEAHEKVGRTARAASR